MERFCSTSLMEAWFSLSGLAPLDVVQRFADLVGYTAAMSSWASGMRRKTQSQVAALEGSPIQKQLWFVSIRCSSEDTAAMPYWAFGLLRSKLKCLMRHETHDPERVHIANTEKKRWEVPYDLLPGSQPIHLDFPLERFVSIRCSSAVHRLHRTQLQCPVELLDH
ncbi:hypothetical protein SUGI_0764980 [Cryptomeria japonica]|nr:hypothetical protein SUGI_0764980 [Cryptomeria japonica]